MSQGEAIKTERARSAAPVSAAGWTGRLADAILLAAFLALTFLYGVFPLQDTDFWWHLRTGDLIRETGLIPTVDTYTFSVPGAPWIDLHWGFQVLVSWGFAHGGVVALNLAKCAFTTLAVWLMVSARRPSWPLWVVLLVWLPALHVMSLRMLVRPETLTLLYLAMFLAVLFRCDRTPALAFLLVPMQILWVNSHALFVFGPLILGMALLGAALERRAFRPERRRWWAIMLSASVLVGMACLVNPYGIRGFLFPAELIRTLWNPVFAEVDELRATTKFIEDRGLHTLQLQMHVFTIVLGALSFVVPLGWWAAVRTRAALAPPVAVTLAKHGKKDRAVTKPSLKKEPLWTLSPFRLLLFVVLSVMSFKAMRISHQLGAVVGTVTAWNFGEWAAALASRRPSALAGSGRRAYGVAVWGRLFTFSVIAAILIAVGSGWLYKQLAEGRLVGLGEYPLWFPHEAIQFAGSPGMPPRFLGFHLGHNSLYEYYYAPERKVFADPRLELMGPAVFAQYTGMQLRITNRVRGWNEELETLGRPVVVADHLGGPGVAATLLDDSRWRCVWFDPIVTVFVSEPIAVTARKAAVDFGARHFQPTVAHTPQSTPALLASAQGLGNIVKPLRARHSNRLLPPLTALGLGYARKARDAEPSSVQAWGLLAAFELLRDTETGSNPTPRIRMDFDPVLDLGSVRAAYALHQLLARAPRDLFGLYLLASLNQSRGMYEEAMELYERVLRLPARSVAERNSQQEVRSLVEALRRQLGSPPPAPVTANPSQRDQLLESLLARGRATRAADVIERGLTSEDRSWEQSDHLARLRLNLGDVERARDAWQQSIAPQPAVRLARIGVTYLVEGQFDAARQSFQESLVIDPRLFEALYSLAILEQDAGNAPAALSAARAAVSSAPNEIALAAAQGIATWVRPYGGETSPAQQN